MTPARILFVDDDPNLLAAFQRNLRKQFTLDTAIGGPEGLELMKQNGPYAVVVADMQMPVMNGVQFLSRVSKEYPDTVRLMLTGNADQQTAIDAVNHGHIFSFLNKPCEPDLLSSVLQSCLKQHELLRVERELLEGTLMGSVKVLGEVLSMIDPMSFGRGQKLRDSMRVFARWLGLSSTWELEVAAMLTHVGYVSVPPAILHKIDQMASLFPRETAIIERTPQIGHDLLVNIPRLEPVAKIVLYQNKHYDGSGYPHDKVYGDKIPLGARILRILIDRVLLEEEGTVKGRALDAMKARTGKYDPTLLEQCFACFQAFLENPISADRPVTTLTIQELQPGLVVVSDVRTLGEVLLISAGNRLSEAMINRLKNYAEFHGVKEPIYVQ